MATPSTSNSTKSVDASLWWEPFNGFLTELENASVSSKLPQSLVVLEYYSERQCLLKCTRQILMHALYFGSESGGGSSVLKEAHQLISDGLEFKLLSIFQDLLSSNYPEQMDVDLYTLWAEETLIEDNLVLDILFLVYYESLCTCDAKCWKRLCTIYEGLVTGSYNFQKLAISPDAILAIYHAKVQLLLILIASLNLENLLQMIHDNVPFRQGSIIFSEMDIQQMDETISSLNAFAAKEAGPLILAWAVFLCLISSLPGKEENSLLTKIDHMGYVRQAFEASSLAYFLEILQSDTLNFSDGHLAGCRSVLRTFISAFIASYEINLQFEDDNLKLILDILCKIYRGEESLCIQFWDKDSFIDGPVRCLLCNLEGEFPFRITQLVNLLSALCEGAWPSECVFNFLDKSVGLSTPIELSSDSVVDAASNFVETRFPLPVAGVEGLVIPSKSRGQVLRMIDENCALVRWEAVRYSLTDAWNSFHDKELSMGNQDKYMRVDVVEIVCSLVKNLSPSVNGAVMMSMCVNILTKMLICGSWLLSGRLAKMLLIDCEQSDCSMTLAVLDFTKSLLETGLETDTVLALIIFSLQYVLVNHEFWKYKVKRARWKVTMKVLEVMKKCISSISCCPKLGEIVCHIMLFDSSIHSTLFRIVCTTATSLEKLYVSRLFDTLDIEGLQQAISCGLDVLVSMISTFSKDSPGLPIFHQAIFSPMTKPIPVITAAISLISYFRDPKIQIGAARLLSALFVEDFSQSYTYSNASLGLDDKQVANFRKSICNILSEQPPCNDDLIIATLKLLTAAARNQPAFLTAVISSKENLSAQVLNADSEHQPNKSENVSLDSKEESLLNAVLRCLKKSEDLFHSNPSMLVCLLNFLRSLWQGAPQFMKTLEQLKVSENFWGQVSYSVLLITSNKGKLEELAGKELHYGYQLLSNVLDILGYEIFLQKKLMHAQMVVNQISKPPINGGENTVGSKCTESKSNSLKEMISTWFKSSQLGDLIKACVSWEYDASSQRAKVAVLFAVQAMVKLRSRDSGSLSVSLIERIVTLSQKELETLILSDLSYHVQGELEGRQIDNRPFKELFQFLLDSNILDAYNHKQDDDVLANVKSIYLYDTVRLRADLGLEMWDRLAWKEIKEVAQTMLLCLQDANSRMLHSNSKLSALRGLIMLLYMHEGNLKKDEDLTALKIPDEVVSSCINHTCQCLHSTLESLTPAPVDSEDVLDIVTAQAELLLFLVRSISNNLSQPDCVLILKTSGYGLKLLCSYKPSLVVRTAKKFLLMLIVSSVEFSSVDLCSDVSGTESVEGSTEVSNSCLGLLPILCNCIQDPEQYTLSLATIDLILKGFSSPATWFAVIQKHLPLQHLVQKLHDRTLSSNVSVTLKFLLNLARVRHGADMLLNAGILASIKTLFSDFSEGGPFSVIQSERIFSSQSDKSEKPEPVWGLGLAVLTALIQSLGESSSASIIDHLMTCILVEKAPLVSYYLSAPDFPTEGHENKRARALKSNISLSELKETQNTLALICVLAKHRSSWKKILQNMESQLREKSIHLLAFISRATQRPGESFRGEAPLLCHPVLKEEFEWYKKQPFINSRNGWFALSALGCKLNPKFAHLSSRTTALTLRDQSKDSANVSPQTHLSDLIAIEMYKIAFLLLNFLCTQAESAARKAEEIGFVDLAHFPELPMPDILHGLQDQGIAIITELCEADKMKQLAPEKQQICLLLLQVTVMALYLEFCVIQICGIRPVSGHVETFSKELRLLVRATEGHVFLKEPLKTLKQIVSFVYPELTQQEALF
ncbi:hypothetical protein MIMGU_mgv1a000102mg [Erythranthe guttata]|uniref:Uncharacterized protein n=1 Tax=Erythranthe guttata TaxID=4155 RepID=A0A022RCF6_ERYGU|nr:hypothetical protein MIMGU_mgv1a000102mg [Erythranthe guttata]